MIKLLFHSIPGLIFCLAFYPDLSGQNASNYHGSPIIYNYNIEEYGGSLQVWAITQDKRGVMYFGDGNGLLEFDGTNWRKYPVKNFSVVRSLAIDSKGIIYIGANNDFGFFKPNSLGILSYFSLSDLLPDSTKAFQSVWKTFVTQQGTYFICRNHIFRWH